MFSSTTKDDTVRNLRGNRSNAASETDLRDVANNAGRKMSGFINSASGEVSHATETVTTQIRTKPLQSAMIAIGIGFVLGALLRR